MSTALSIRPGSVLPMTVNIPLMTGPVETVTTTVEKQQHYLLNEVEEKLKDLEHDEQYELSKTRMALICLLSSIAAIMLIFFATGFTVLFAVRTRVRLLD